MSTPHTPGLWEVTVTGAVRAANGSIVASVPTVGDIRNSYLIAAAPDLLAALRELIAHRDELGLADYPAITRARAAIAKAEGGK